LPEQGIGEPVSTSTPWTGGIVDRSWFTAPELEKYRRPGNVKVPFWLQPERYYAGAAWYRREVRLPVSWAGQRIELFLERPHWETRVWWDGAPMGTNLSLSTPHEYYLGLGVAGRHTLCIRVDNRMVVDVGENSHSVSDHTQGNWNGIVGAIELRATPPVWVSDLEVHPRVDSRSVLVKGQIGNVTGRDGRGQVALAARPVLTGGGRRTVVSGGSWSPGSRRSIDATWSAQGGTFQTELALGEGAPLWDEFNPACWELEGSLDFPGLEAAPRFSTARRVRFGLREIAAAGTQFTINGRRTFIRGTLECCIFPRTGHPPTDVAAWRRLVGTAKAHGLNCLRFHSWCPPEAAFTAADELGMYLHVECASWANQSTALGDGKPVDAWVYEEAERILKCYGNHPSFAFLLYGNEPGGAKHGAYLKEWVAHFRALDPRRLYSGGAGWPQLAEDQFHVTPEPRIQAWGGGLQSRINAQPPETTTDYRAYVEARRVPVISHEIGQWCVYPNFAEMAKYTGHLKARNFEVFRDTLAAKGMFGQARQFLLASGKLQVLCYKEDIESALRTPGMGGFQLLDLHDFPGQGTALVGVLDPFWEEKGYVTPEAYRRFCNATVPLARLARRVFTADERLEAEVEVAHFGPAPLAATVPTWTLVSAAGAAVRHGTLPLASVPVGNGVRLGHVSVPLQSLAAPARYKLVVRLEPTSAVGAAGGSKPGTPTSFENDWDVWVYPSQVDTAIPPGITVVNEFGDQALTALNAGERVLLLLPPERVRPDPKLGKTALGFSSIFWNTAWTGRQPPHTLGILCDPKHPLFAEFPTESHSNWQWWYLVTRAGAMILDDLPAGLRPTVQVVDDWVTARKLGLVFEARVGAGRLAVCAIDLERDLGPNPVARQFRRSLLQYIASDQFRPKVAVAADQVRSLIGPRARAEGTK
jgi:hypothetical protein